MYFEHLKHPQYSYDNFIYFIKFQWRLGETEYKERSKQQRQKQQLRLSQSDQVRLKHELSVLTENMA